MSGEKKRPGRKKSGRKEKAIFVALSETEKEILLANMKHLRAKHKITLSELLRKVLTEKIIDDDFLKYIGFNIKP